MCFEFLMKFFAFELIAVATTTTTTTTTLAATATAAPPGPKTGAASASVPIVVPFFFVLRSFVDRLYRNQRIESWAYAHTQTHIHTLIYSCIMYDICILHICHLYNFSCALWLIRKISISFMLPTLNFV